MMAIPPRMKDDLLQTVVEVAGATSLHGWERGTYAQAILELETPTLVPFSSSFSVPLLSSPSPTIPPAPSAALVQAHWALSHRPTATTFPLGLGKALLRDDSTSDPASLTTCCLLAYLMGEKPPKPGGDVAGDHAPVIGWVEAVENQIDFLLHHVAKTLDGALSHRISDLCLWADFVYMAPPSVAYYALLTSRRDFLKWSYTQCGLQRKYFRNPGTGLWKHIVLGDGSGKSDPYCWATSGCRSPGVKCNAWAAAGMLRVLATIMRSLWVEEMQKEIKDLHEWSQEIVAAAATRATPSGMIRNYVDEPDSFEESSGTALLAYCSYRLAYLHLSTTHIAWAHRARSAVYDRIAVDGVLGDVCDIHDERLRRDLSAEGQSFVILMEAAFRDWEAMK